MSKYATIVPRGYVNGRRSTIYALMNIGNVLPRGIISPKCAAIANICIPNATAVAVKPLMSISAT